MAQQIADNDARLSALQDNLARGILRSREGAVVPSGTDGQRQPEIVPADGEAQSALIDEIKRQLQSEMGLMPVRLLRERRDSFVELNAIDNFGKTSYGTAGYLGDGYFITVKHGVIALDDPGEGRDGRRIVSITIRYKNKDLPATLVDSGDANVEVHSGDWAIIRVRGKVDLPALRIDTAYNYDFAEPIFRLGNDYSKGIILSTGYVGQRTANGLVTCLPEPVVFSGSHGNSPMAATSSVPRSLIWSIFGLSPGAGTGVCADAATGSSSAADSAMPRRTVVRPMVTSC